MSRGNIINGCVIINGSSKLKLQSCFERSASENTKILEMNPS